MELMDITEIKTGTMHQQCLSVRTWSNTFNWVVSSVYSSTACFSPGGGIGILDRLSVDELCTGVDVRWASRFCLFCPLPLFGVLGKKHAVVWLRMAKSLPGSAFDSSVAGDKTVSEVTFFVGVFLGFLFLVFRGPPERSPTVTILMTSGVASDLHYFLIFLIFCKILKVRHYYLSLLYEWEDFIWAHWITEDVRFVRAGFLHLGDWSLQHRADRPIKILAAMMTIRDDRMAK